MIGDFEIHLTVQSFEPSKLQDFAAQHGLKYTQIELDRGVSRTQRMLTIASSGTLAELHDVAKQWTKRISQECRYGHTIRVKIEAAPWNTGVPSTDEAAAGDPEERYFEHHVKLRLPHPGVATRVALSRLASQHGARLSRNARRTNAQGVQERFVTQRCWRVGRPTARAKLDALVDALRTAGHELLEVEQEYVVHDSYLGLDRGWMTAATPHQNASEEKRRTAPAGTKWYPSTYLPISPDDGVRQRAVFDRALKQFGNAFRAGEPQFADPGAGLRWRDARRAAMMRVLAALTGSAVGEHLVLRGSLPLRVWLGDAAREPGDLDFVVVPTSIDANGKKGQHLITAITDALRGVPPEAGLDTDRIAVETIWMYERSPGKRIAVPFAAPETPGGAIQVDVVFNQSLLGEDPIRLELPPLRTSVLAAPPHLALLWKLMWLFTDQEPRGKDLFDATLLAELPDILVDKKRRDLLDKHLWTESGFTSPIIDSPAGHRFDAGGVLNWSVDWREFSQEHPWVAGDAEEWQQRLALALLRWFPDDFPPDWADRYFDDLLNGLDPDPPEAFQ